MFKIFRYLYGKKNEQELVALLPSYVGLNIMRIERAIPPLRHIIGTTLLLNVFSTSMEHSDVTMTLFER